MPVDLDKWERDARFVEERPYGTQLRVLSVEPEAVLALVAELRAARDVVQAARDATGIDAW